MYILHVCTLICTCTCLYSVYTIPYTVHECHPPTAVVSDSQDTPRLNHALQGSGCITSSGSDNDSTPVPASTEEGSSQEEEGDIMNVSTSSSLDDDELPLTPVVQPQEQGTNKEDREGEGEGVCSEGGVSKAGSKSGGKNNKGFILSLFGKKPINLRDADHQLRKPQMAVTSLIPARNSPRKIETRKVSWYMLCFSTINPPLLHAGVMYF